MRRSEEEEDAEEDDKWTILYFFNKMFLTYICTFVLVILYSSTYIGSPRTN